MPSLVEIGSSGSEEEDENVKSLLIDRHTDGQQALRKAHFSFQLRWGRVCSAYSKMYKFVYRIACRRPNPKNLHLIKLMVIKMRVQKTKAPCDK